MQNAECRIGPKAVSCTRCRMQMQNAECTEAGPKSYSCVRDVLGAGCRMQECRIQKLTHSQERADRVPMQDAGAECKNSPNYMYGSRRGQKRVVQNAQWRCSSPFYLPTAQCRCRIQNPTQECTVCAERVCMVQMLSMQTVCCMLHVIGHTSGARAPTFSLSPRLDPLGQQLVRQVLSVA